MELIYDLNTISYFPNIELFYLPTALICIAVYLFFIKNYKLKIIHFTTLFYSFGIALTLLIFRNDYSNYKENIRLHTTGKYHTLKGQVERINANAGPSYQTITIKGKTLFLKKNNSVSFDGDFQEVFTVGECLIIEYVRTYDGIIKIFLKNKYPNHH